jgi:hypothetical protein
MSKSKEWNMPHVTIQQNPAAARTAPAEKQKRYTRLSGFYPDSWSPAVPVVVQRGAVLQDNLSGAAMLQLKLCNCGEAAVRSVYLAIECFDDAGDPCLTEENEALRTAYLDLNCPPGGAFGDKQPIRLPAPSIRTFRFTFEKIVFENGDVLHCEEEEKYALEKPVPITSLIPEETLNRLGEEDVRFVPQKLEGGWWRCVCGSLSRSGSCPDCGREKERARLFLSRSALEKDLLRRDREIANKELEEILTAHGAALPQRVSLLALKISCPLSVAAALLFFVFDLVLAPSTGGAVLGLIMLLAAVVCAYAVFLAARSDMRFTDPLYVCVLCVSCLLLLSSIVAFASRINVYEGGGVRAIFGFLILSTAATAGLSAYVFSRYADAKRLSRKARDLLSRSAELFPHGWEEAEAAPPAPASFSETFALLRGAATETASKAKTKLDAVPFSEMRDAAAGAASKAKARLEAVPFSEMRDAAAEAASKAKARLEAVPFSEMRDAAAEAASKAKNRLDSADAPKASPAGGTARALFCGACGARREEGAVFCPACGVKLEE